MPELLRKSGSILAASVIPVSVLIILILEPLAEAKKAIQISSEIEFRTDLYQSVMVRKVVDEQELNDEMLLDYQNYAVLMVPGEDFTVAFDGGVLPYDAFSFPKVILSELTRTELNGIPSYSIIMWIDPVTWETVIFDAVDGKEVYRIQPDRYFNPLDLITDVWGETTLLGASDTELLTSYSPSRMWLQYDLIESKDVPPLILKWSVPRNEIKQPGSPQITRGSSRSMRSSSSDFKITAMAKTTSGMELTIQLPTGWASTNDIDVFGTDNLTTYWWELLTTTNGSNTITWTDTESTDDSIATRYYNVGDGETDTDSDGYTDAREELMYHSDPDDENSFPVTVSGSVTHPDTSSAGPVYILAVTGSNSWDLGRSTKLTSTGAYSIAGIPNQDDYFIKAWRDWHQNGSPDEWEATGTATNYPIYLTNSVSNIVITLIDPPAGVAGTISYTGLQSGVCRAVAVASSGSWSTNYCDVLATPGAYFIDSLSQTDYYVKAWIDADSDGLFDTNNEASGTWPSNPISLSNSVWQIDFDLTDVNGDGDSMPDWWEIHHFGNTNQSDSGDYDGDTMPNGWEYTWSFCPTNPADAMEDIDGDGYFNVYEYHHDSNPWNSDATPGMGGGGGSGEPEPTVIVVSTGTIQAGLDAATNAYDIVRVDPGTYTGTGNRALALPNHPVLLIAKEAATNTIIDCGGTTRAITFSGQSNHTSIAYLGIVNGSNSFGGAIAFASNSMPVVTACIFTNCASSDDGGALHIADASPLIDTCTFMNNSAGDDGGAIRCDGDSTAAQIVNCVFIDNHAADKGGAVYCTDDTGDIRISGCTFTENTASDNGGAVAVKDADLLIDACVVYKNAATNDGGGIHLSGTTNTIIRWCAVEKNEAHADGGGIRCKDDADATIIHCDIIENIARDNGAGLFCNDSSDPVVSNCVFIGNLAWDHGGGLYVKESSAWIGHSLIVSNTATDGAGIGCLSSTPTIVTCAIGDNLACLDGAGIRSKDSAPTVRNSLIAGNRSFGQGGGIHFKGGTGTVENLTIADNISVMAGGGIAITDSGVVTGANTVIWGNTPDQCHTNATFTYSCITGWSGPTMITNAPLLASGTYHLLTNSPCINEGTNLAWTTGSVDIDGEPRVINTNVDIGCDEWQNGSDGGSASWSSTGAGGPVGPDELGLGITMYDHSGSASELYRISFSNSVTNIIVQSPDFGIPWSEVVIFQKGTSYTVRIEHIDTNGGSDCFGGAEDYDYTAWIDGVPASTNGAHSDWVFGAGFALHDPDGIMGTHGYGGCTSTFDADGKTATLYIIRVDVTECYTYTNPSTSTETKYEIATIPGREDTNTWTSVLEGCDATMDVTIKYERLGSEADVAWEGMPGDLYFTNGALNVDIALLDGSNSTPKMAINAGVLEINSVQQGDRIIVEEDQTECRDELAVVKNFTWNDLQRLGTSNLVFDSNYSSLDPDLRATVVDTIVFSLDPDSSSSQEQQRTNSIMAGVMVDNEYTNFPSSYTNLCQLDIPSAVGVGFFPADLMHWHMALTNSLSSDVINCKTQLAGLASANYTNSFEDMELATREKLVDLLNAATSNSTALTVYHTYEGDTSAGELLPATYVDSAGVSTLQAGDPIRNIRMFIGDQPRLFFSGQEDWAAWRFDPPYNVWQVVFFVGRSGLVIYQDSYRLFEFGREGQIADACKE